MIINKITMGTITGYLEIDSLGSRPDFVEIVVLRILDILLTNGSIILECQLVS